MNEVNEVTRRQSFFGIPAMFMGMLGFRKKLYSKEEICKNIHKNTSESIVWTYRFSEKFSTTKVYKSEKREYVLIEWKDIQIGDVLLLVENTFIRRTLATSLPDISKDDNSTLMVAENAFNQIPAYQREILGI